MSKPTSAPQTYAAPTPDPLAIPLAPHRRRVIMAGLIVAMALGALDQSIVNTALPCTASDLGGLAHLSWVMSLALLLSFALKDVEIA